MDYNLKIGDASNNGQVTIIDEDRLCYLVRSESKGGQGIRTISKAMLKEFVDYVKSHSNATAMEARYALSGKSDLDKYEYGYNSTYMLLAHMVITGEKTKIDEDILSHQKSSAQEHPRQIIYYGAPGTGKSNRIDELTNEGNRIRTTFHPDSDYSTFVGVYKPTMDGKAIAYKFVPQAFLKAYVEAWERKSEGNEEPFYLVIEEINRGNCAQIFGDLFQLLDRDDEGKSRYGICPDDDIKRYLQEAFEKCNDLPKEIKDGDEMRLPSNLYIWATMNTSDQSLFPIDSAFKRRWDWEYMPIADAGKGHVIEIGDKQYDWWIFISIINDKIGKITSSEDKKLGYWFVVPANGGITISSKQFVSKVLFYLWNDVYKDYMESSENIFKTLDDGKVNEAPFTSFFGTDAEERLQGFMAYNGIKPMEGYKEIGNQYEPVVNESEEADSYNSTKDTSEYTVNGKGPFKKTIVAAEVFKAYIENNTNSTAKEIESLWKTFNQSPVLHLFEDEEGYKQYHKDNQRTKKRFECVVFKGTNFYLWKDWGVDNFDYIKSIAQRLGIIITKIPQ